MIGRIFKFACSVTLIYNVIKYKPVNINNMKTKYPLFIIPGLVLCLFSCKKDGGTNPTAIIGKWGIAKTVYYQARDTTITGLATDYYNFSSDGSLTIQDHQDSYNGIYSLNGTKSVGITIRTIDGHGTGVITSPAVFTISNLTDHSVTLTSPPYPSGQEIVFLQK